MNEVDELDDFELVHVTMPENLYKAAYINSIVKERTVNESIMSFLKLYFRKPDGLHKMEEEGNTSILKRLKKKSHDVKVTFCIDSDIYSEVSKKAAEFGISVSEYICIATVDCTTLTIINYRLA